MASPRCQKRAPTTPEHPARRGPKAPNHGHGRCLTLLSDSKKTRSRMASPRCQKTRPYHTVPGGARRLPTMDAATPEWHPQDAKKRAPTTPERRARRCPKASNHGHGRCLTLLSDLKKTRSRNGIPKMLKNAPLPHRTPCQEVPEGSEPWTRPVPNIAFWFEENEVQNGIPKMPRNAPLPHQNTVPGGARRPRTTAGA